MEWQSEQEKRESKSIYHSEKESSYIPVIPKVEAKSKEINDETGEQETSSATKSEEDSKKSS